jgi:hypothetical protein
MGGNMDESASNTSCSKASNVWKMRAEAFCALSISITAKSSIRSFGSVVLMKLGRSLKRIPFKPGIQSMTVSKYPFVK